MKKWLIPAFLLIAVSAYFSSTALDKLEDPLFCAGCHSAEYNTYLMPANNSVMPAHKENNINCIECHSSSGLLSGLDARKFLIKVQLVNYSLPAINTIFQVNSTFGESFKVSDFTILKADCTKCHNLKKIKSLEFNHANASDCEYCHIFHTEKQRRPEVSFWKHMGEGGHKNLTCGNCHGTEAGSLNELPQCTKCHTPHLKGAKWDRSVCLGCHSDPHIPIKNATFKGNITKEMCSACHNDVYQILTIYNSKHNKLPCTGCHPVHREKLSCRSCHEQHGQLHSGSKCTSCHGYVKACTDCHTNPHAPLSGVPIITGNTQWSDYAMQAGKK